jgi:EAL domain-containing protein (putative c-di-GMP-specific phosphodiesterase class I)
MAVTAEGIETADQHDYLKALGCDNGQGYLIGVPASFEGLAEIVAQRRAKKVIAA